MKRNLLRKSMSILVTLALVLSLMPALTMTASATAINLSSAFDINNFSATSDYSDNGDMKLTVYPRNDGYGPYANYSDERGDMYIGDVVDNNGADYVTFEKSNATLFTANTITIKLEKPGATVEIYGLDAGGSIIGTLTTANITATSFTTINVATNPEATGNFASIRKLKIVVPGTGYYISALDVTAAASYNVPTLSATGGNPTFTENDSSVDLFSGVTAATNDTDQTFSGMTLTVSNVTDSKEVLSISGTDVELTNGKSGSLSGGGNYSVTVSSNTATVTVSGMSLSEAQMGTLIDGITYRNTSEDPSTASSRAIKITGITDSGSSNNSASPSITATVSITAVNDAPTLSANALNPTFTEDGSAATLFSGALVSTGEASQAITELKLTVSNAADGSDEVLNADGSDIVLTNGTTGTTATNGMAYSVSVSAGMATVTMSKPAGISTAAMQTLVNGISYKDNSNTPTTGNRVVTLTSLTDNGGGVDTTALSVASTVTVAAANDAPFTRNISSFLKLGANAAVKSAAGTYATSQIDNITLESWIYLDNTTGTRPVLFNGNGGNSGYGIFLDGATVNVLMGGVGWIRCSSGTSYNAANRSVLTAGQWTHIAVTRKTGEGTDGWNVYINGHPMATAFESSGPASGIPNPLNAGSNVQIGPSASEGLSVSEARIWTRALTQSEIQANMSGTVAANASGLVGYWKLADGSGTTATDIQANQAALNLPITGSITWAASTAGSTAEDTPLSGRLAGGDIETSVTYAKASDPAHGTVTVNTDGSYTYTPSADYNGSDSFTFITNDGSDNSASQVVNITVTPVNDVPTNIALDNSSIAEGSPADTTIGTLTTTDPDAGDTFTYSIQSVKDKNNNDVSIDTFAISGSQLRTKAPLSYSANNSYKVTIETSDGTATYDQIFIITVTEVNAAPTDISLSKASVDENKGANFEVGTLTATDPNLSDTSFTYALVAGTDSADNGSFSISGDRLMLTNSADFETKPSYSVRIQVRDNGGLTFEKPFTISVVDVNEAPVVTASGGTSTFSEAATGTSTPVVVDSGLTVSDVDSGTILTSVTATISANYYSAQDVLSFTNDGSTMGDIAASFDSGTGVLTLTSASGTATIAQWQAALRAVKYTNTSHNPATAARTITFTVSDGFLTASATQNVSIMQANSAPTDIALANSTVAENTEVGTTVGTLSATDADDDDTVTFSLVSGYGDNASFTIESNALKLAVSPNYEVKNSYSIRVHATDLAGATCDKDFTITISNVNEAPSITSVGTVNFAENGTETAYTATRTDPDVGDTVSWSLGGEDEALFSIDTDGKVTFKAAPNYENKKDVNNDNVYKITVIAKDLGGLTASKDVAITVTNVNEAPVISTKDAISVTEGSTEAFAAEAADPENDTLSWSITGGTDAGKFLIDTDTGVVTFKTAPSYSTPTDADTNNDYVLDITASDGTLSATKTVTVTVTQKASGGSSTTTGAVVEVNGQKQDAGTAATTTTGGQTVTAITVDDTKLEKILDSSGEKPKVTLPSSGCDVTIGELNGQTVKNMEKKEAVLEIKTDSVTYTLPATQINIDAVSGQLGKQVALKDIKVSVKIAEPTADTVKVVENTASKGNYQLVVKPVEFQITCTSGNKTVEVSKFNGYVQRTVAIPDGVDPSKITTGIVLNADGTFRHVPTEIIIVNGKYFAKINSLTNSTYSVIYNPVEFADAATHWAKAAINDMGSRMVVTGVGKSTYEPDRSITRAEFATIVVKALGLAEGTTESNFGDVALTDWFNGSVDTATAYALISGYNSASFGPNDKITREQAMVILAKAMKITGLSTSLTDSQVNALLAKYTDAASVSNYAKMSTAICIKTGVVTGSSATTLSPKAAVTRAEVAVMVQRLLQKSGLI